MNRNMSVDLANVLVNEFDKTGIEDTIDEYIKFVHAFAEEHGMKIYGKVVDKWGWRTEGFDFNSKEDELVFVLKYGRIEIT